MLGLIIKWGAVLGIVAFVVSQPHQAANMITSFFGGIAEFFKALVGGLGNIF